VPRRASLPHVRPRPGGGPPLPPSPRPAAPQRAPARSAASRRAPPLSPCPGGRALPARPGGRARLGRAPASASPAPRAVAARRRPCRAPWPRPRPRPCPHPCPGDSRPACLTVRVPSARVTCSHACDRSRTALNLVLIYFKLFSRRAASRASSRDDSFNL
jgi:hypothetical protein